MTPQAPPKRSFRAAPAQAQSGTGNVVTALASRDDGVWPDLLRWLYETGEYVLSAGGQNRLAVLGLQGQFPSQEDFTGFMKDFDETATFTVVQVNGGVNNPTNPSKQANADIQYAAAMSFPTPVFFYSVGGDLADDAFLHWFSYILNPAQLNIPQTISISYGDYEPNLPVEYALAVCLLFMHLGSRGVSVLVASGSEGVGPGDCEDGDGNVKFVPEFPSSCTCGVQSPLPVTRLGQVQVAHQTAIFTGPWVTSVGGTTGNPEVAASLSGGGFSTYFPYPMYQFDAVDQYLQNHGGNHASRYK